MNDDIKVLINRIEETQRVEPLVKATGNVLATGLAVSNLALNQPERIALTPYTKNMFQQLDKRDRLLVSDKKSKMEEYVEQETIKLLHKYVGDEVTQYDGSLAPDDFYNYRVDCGRNFKRGTDIRHAKPGMNKDRLKSVKKFEGTPHRLPIMQLLDDPVFDKALKGVINQIPEVKSSDDWVTTNAPFQTKHTNTGYPYFANDQRVIKPAIKDSTGKIIKPAFTYGNKVDLEARKLTPKQVARYPGILFGRNLRQKARVIIGGSRLQALVFNQLEHSEIEAYKESSPLYIGYNDDEYIRDKMILLSQWFQDNPDYTCANRDYSAFDTTVSPDLRRLVDAISYLKTIDPRGKEIAFGRAVSHDKMALVNGLNQTQNTIYGRIFSGEIDTNRGGGLANAIMDIYTILKLQPSGIDDVGNPLIRAGTSPLGVMGDDNLLSFKRGVNENSYSQLLHKTFGTVIDPSKTEYGIYFAQRRLINSFGDKAPKGYLYLTPFTRIIRSLCSKELPKGLGPAGGTIATYQLLFQLIDGPDLMVDVAKIFAKFDEVKLGTKGSVKEMKNLVAEEDRLAQASDPRSKTTADRLFDGDPAKGNGFTDQGELNYGLVEQVHDLLVKALHSDNKQS